MKLGLDRLTSEAVDVERSQIDNIQKSEIYKGAELAHLRPREYHDRQDIGDSPSGQKQRWHDRPQIRLSDVVTVGELVSHLIKVQSD